jgi:hypothetical protein
VLLPRVSYNVLVAEKPSSSPDTAPDTAAGSGAHHTNSDVGSEKDVHDGNCTVSCGLHYLTFEALLLLADRKGKQRETGSQRDRSDNSSDEEEEEDVDEDDAGGD